MAEKGIRKEEEEEEDEEEEEEEEEEEDWGFRDSRKSLSNIHSPSNVSKDSIKQFDLCLLWTQIHWSQEERYKDRYSITNRVGSTTIHDRKELRIYLLYDKVPVSAFSKI
jgi:hypothetical protein